MDGAHLIELPTGLTTRAMTMDDVDLVTDLVAACEAHDAGMAEIDREDILADWTMASFELSQDSVGVFDGTTLVAHADVRRGKAEANVHPQHRGRGVGSWLLRWTEQRARAQGVPSIGQTLVDTNVDGTTLLERHGYAYRHTSWVLRIEHPARPPEPDLPDGIAFRPYRRDIDDHEIFDMVEDAFNEWPTRQPSTFGDWYPFVLGRESFEPWMMLLAVDGSTAEIVGVAHLIAYEGLDSGWVQQLATRSTHRHRGIARALLQRASVISWDQGRNALELSTDSRTGALGLYERIGMRVRASYTNRAKDLL